MNELSAVPRWYGRPVGLKPWDALPPTPIQRLKNITSVYQRPKERECSSDNTSVPPNPSPALLRPPRPFPETVPRMKEITIFNNNKRPASKTLGRPPPNSERTGGEALRPPSSHGDIACNNNNNNHNQQPTTNNQQQTTNNTQQTTNNNNNNNKRISVHQRVHWGGGAAPSSPTPLQLLYRLGCLLSRLHGLQQQHQQQQQQQQQRVHYG